MSGHLELIPEGLADRVLLQSLGYAKPNNGFGISDVLNKIDRQFSNRLAIGLVDNDKRKPLLFDRYDQLIKTQDQLELRRKPQTRHFLIVICPALEIWLLYPAEIGLRKASIV